MSRKLLQPQFDPVGVLPGELLRMVWETLDSACCDLEHPWRLPGLATVFEGIPSQRTVVLRRVLIGQRRLLAHTDFRSPKIRHLQQQPKVSWLFYDPASRIQLVVSGTVSIHTEDDLADEEWNRTPDRAKSDYQSQLPPGTPVDRPQSGSVPETLTIGNPGRENFAVLACDVSTFDLLLIRPTGHLRLRFEEHTPDWKVSWLVP